MWKEGCCWAGSERGYSNPNYNCQQEGRRYSRAESTGGQNVPLAGGSAMLLHDLPPGAVKDTEKLEKSDIETTLSHMAGRNRKLIKKALGRKAGPQGKGE